MSGMILIDGSHIGSGSLAVWTKKEGLQEEVWGKHTHFDSKETEGGRVHKTTDPQANSKSVTKQTPKLALRNVSQQGFLYLPSASMGMLEEGLQGPGQYLAFSLLPPFHFTRALGHGSISHQEPARLEGIVLAGRMVSGVCVTVTLIL